MRKVKVGFETALSIRRDMKISKLKKFNYIYLFAHKYMWEQTCCGMCVEARVFILEVSRLGSL